MGALKLTACMKVVSKMGEMDQESLLERLDRYTADGVPKDRAQVMAAADTLAELQDERREFMRLLREQHPQLFVVTNVIPEDQDVDPDAPDIQRSPGRSEEEIAVARADGWTIADNDLPSREAAERIVKLRTKGNSVVKPMPAWQEAEVRVVESDNPGLWSIEVRNPGIQRSPARDITDTPEFKRWFGDSKVVDEKGTPLEVYHATGAKFNAFDPGKTGSNYPSYAKRGFFFYRSQQSATERAYEFGSNARLKRVYLSLQNPLVVTARSKGSAEEWFDRNNQTLYSRAEKAGSDGIIVKVNPDSNDYAAEEIFIAFEPTQIKSSRGNNGQFDSSNADITRSPARQTETPEFKEWFGDSVMTEDGRPGGEPMTLYHGGFNFADAPTGKAVPKTGNRGSLGVGFYMTPDQSRAQEYADENDGVVTQVYVRMNRPLEIRIGRGQDPMIEALVELGMPRGKAETKVESAYEKYGYIGSEVKKLALDAGYDGLIEYIDGRMSEVVAWTPTQVKSATDNDGQFSWNPDIRRSSARNAMGFYSALAKGVEDMQTKQAPAGAWKTQIKGLVNKGQVKQDEIEWSGIEDFLDLQQGKVTKDQILEYLRGNGVQVEEVTLGATGLDGVGEMYVDEANDYGDEWAVFTEEGGIIGGTYSTQEEAEDAMASMSQDLPSKYSKYTLPGGENYREVLLTLPERPDRTMTYQVLGAYPRDGFKSREEAQAYIDSMTSNIEAALADPVRSEVGKVMQAELKKYPFKINEYESKESRSKDYRSNHWDQPNILAHIRVNDRTDADGKRVLFVEEIQSDWGQEGKKKGIVKSYKPDEVQPISAVEAGKMTVADEELFWHFKTPDNVFSIPKSKYADREAARDYIIREKKINSGGVPDAPFIGKTDGWLNLALKRVIAMAVDGGYDAVAFVNGDQSADHYDLSKRVAKVTYNINKNSISAYADDRPGAQSIFTRAASEDELPDIIGKEVADRLINAEPNPNGLKILRGLDLKVGGEGMKAFYDKIVPNAVKALLKKVGGGQLEMVSIPDPEGTGRTMEVSRSPMFGGGRETIAIADEPPLQQPGFAITDAMREKVSTEGLTLFSRKRAQEDTPEFKAWSGEAPLVRLGERHEFRSGQPVVAEALHGTTNSDLTEFKRERASIESDWGAGFYASNTPDDVAANYANNDGPDLTRRVERLAEQIANDDEFDGDMDDAMSEARKRISEDSPNTLKLYVGFKNPAVLGGNGETYFDYAESYNEDADEYGEPTGLLVDFIDALDEAGSGLDVSMRDLENTKARLLEVAEGEGLKLGDLARIVKDGMSDTYSEDGNSSGSSEILRQALESMGFDGIIDTKVVEKFGPRMIKGAYSTVKTDGMPGMNKDTVHFIAFKPTQLKSATGNRGTFDPSDADITRSAGRTSTGAAWDSPSAEKFDDLVYKLQDKLVDTKRVVEAIKTASGSIADDLNVYLQEELYHGRAAKRTEDFVNMELNPLIEQMARDGLKLEDVEEFMHARHAPEANAVIAQRNPGVAELQDGGSGMKTADALQYMATLPADLKQKLEAATVKVDAIIAKTRELYVDYELESRDTVDAWGKMFQHYIPLMREDKDGNGSPGLGQGFSIKGKEVKGRTGSTRKVVDILANIALQRERAIVRGEKNRVSQALVGLASSNPNEGFWQVDEVPTERVFNEKTGLVEDRVDPLYKSRENAVIAKIKGADGKVKEHAVLFNEEDPRALRMAQALKNLDANQIEGLLGVSAKITRYFAAINTQYNPVFGAVNLVRDVQGALLNLSSTPLAGDQAKIGRYTMSALRGIYADARAARKGNNPTSQWAALWDEFQEVGGQTGYRDLFATSADRAEAIKNTLNPDAWADSRLGKIFTANGALKVPMAQAKRGAGWIFQWLSDYNLAMENGVRLAAYKAGLEKGLSKEQAASAAKNITVNFNRKGQVSQQAGAMYAFFNASLQGTARLGQTLFDMEPGKPKTIRLSSTGKKIVYGGIMLGSIQALALAAAGFNDDDPPEFARERGLIVPIGGKKYLTIPMPLGFHVIPNIGRIATEFALSGFKDPHERALSLASLFADTFNPIGNSGLSMQTLAPTALDPLVALTENRDWTGKPIARESRNPAIPGHALGRDTASSIAKLLSEGINTLSGGNKYVAGVFSPTPDQIDYLLGQVTGGVGRELSKVEQTVLATARGEDLPTYKVPLVGRFVGDAKSQASEGAAFYANTERLNKLETEIKGLEKDGKRAEAAELRRNSSEAYLITVANQAERQIQRLRSEKRELVKAGAPREQVKAVEERITAVMARLNRAAEALREKQEG